MPSPDAMPLPWSPDLLARLGALATADGVAELAQVGLEGAGAARFLADFARDHGMARPDAASRWLDVADALNRDREPGLDAQISYARARIWLVQGDLDRAESDLRRAQTIWQGLGETAAYARSFLGLIHILTVQGRYAEAEAAVRQMVSLLEAQSPEEPDSPESPLPALQIAWAQRNLGNLLRYQERHAAALDAYEQSRAILRRHLAAAADPGAQSELRQELAHLDLNQATVLLHLDRPAAAEAMLTDAADAFAATHEPVGRGQAYANLAFLYLRTGAYAQALDYFERASADLLGDEELAAASGVADMLLLEQALAHLAVNLLPEAEAGLLRCLQLFRTAGLPYELGQALHGLGLLRARQGDMAAAREALQEGLQHFQELDNPYWINRMHLALAQVALGTASQTEARQQLDALILEEAAGQTAADFYLRMEAGLLDVELRLAGDSSQTLGTDTTARLAELRRLLEEAQLPDIHLRRRLFHAQGRLAYQRGDAAEAAASFRQAVGLLEQERISLSVEEVRAAFLDDKLALYSDWLLSLLESGPDDEETLALAFSIMEQARSRALLERLLGTVVAGTDVDDPATPREEELRSRLHWLYNQLLGENGSRRAAGETGEEVRRLELDLRRLARRRDGRLPYPVEPAQLDQFRQTLQSDQVAVVYFMARPAAGSPGEVMAFVVDRQRISLHRKLCTPGELNAALTEFRFQMGRAELGPTYLARHGARLQDGLRQVLHRLFALLMAPLAHRIQGADLLIIPYGELHRLPFHILWDGGGHLLERSVCTYVASASLAVHLQDDGPSASLPYDSLAGLALTDDAIPQAPAEVAEAARHFPHSWQYLDHAANHANLAQAARQAHVLHIATHGLFRLDNPFFSSLKLADGWIDVHALYRLPIQARLVVLSACESGVGDVQGGDEVIGLARGFLGAGARNLVVSLWNVHDASAATLMGDFYRALRDPDAAAHSPARALRRAQLAALARAEHPYFWAPYLVVGL